MVANANNNQSTLITSFNGEFNHTQLQIDAGEYRQEVNRLVEWFADRQAIGFTEWQTIIPSELGLDSEHLPTVLESCDVWCNGEERGFIIKDNGQYYWHDKGMRPGTRSWLGEAYDRDSAEGIVIGSLSGANNGFATTRGWIDDTNISRFEMLEMAMSEHWDDMLSTLRYDAVHEAIDQHEWVIYTAKAHAVVWWSKGLENDFDPCILEGCNDLSTVMTRLAFDGMLKDVLNGIDEKHAAQDKAEDDAKPLLEKVYQFKFSVDAETMTVEDRSVHCEACGLTPDSADYGSHGRTCEATDEPCKPVDASGKPVRLEPTKSELIHALEWAAGRSQAPLFVVEVLERLEGGE